jgi:hypothetical protein
LPCSVNPDHHLTSRAAGVRVAPSSPVGPRVRRTWHLKRVPCWPALSYTRARDSLTGAQARDRQLAVNRRPPSPPSGITSSFGIGWHKGLSHVPLSPRPVPIIKEPRRDPPKHPISSGLGGLPPILTAESLRFTEVLRRTGNNPICRHYAARPALDSGPEVMRRCSTVLCQTTKIPDFRGFLLC